MHNHNMSRTEGRDNRRYSGVVLAPARLAGLLLLSALTTFQLRAQTNTAKALPSSNRWLLIVETSHSMQGRADGVLQTVQDLLKSRLRGQLRQGDTLGIWTFNEGLYMGRFPLQTWSPEAQQDIASRTLTFLKAQQYEKQASLDTVLPDLSRVIKDSLFLTIILISSGDEKMHGTPFDDRINESYQKWHDQQEKTRMPFVTVLRAKNGQLTNVAVNTPQSAETIQSKLVEALHNAPPPTASPLIVSGKKPQPGKVTAPKEEPAGVKVEAPAVAAAATSTDKPLAAKPPVPAMPPAAMAITDAAPLMPGKSSTELAPKPSPVPTPVTEPKVEIVKAAETRSAAPVSAPPGAVTALPTTTDKPKPLAIEPPKPAPEPKPALATAPAPAPAATQQIPASAPALFPSSDDLPPSSVPATPVQTATAVPAETLVRHRSIWIAGLVLAGVAAGFAFLLLRRSGPAAGASLITRSIERENKP